MSALQSQLEALASGQEPQEEALEQELKRAPLAFSADGVMVPFRPHSEDNRGKTKWREMKVGVLARLERYTTRSGQVVTRLRHRRLVAVLGEIEVFKPRFWLEALRQGIRSAPRGALAQ